jgi:hypothetical protein
VPALKPSGFLPIFGCAVHAWEWSRTLPKL